MPHQCTNCGRAFADGSKQMLAGCPDCGGNKFQFLPESAVDEPSGGEEVDPAEASPAARATSATDASQAGDADIIEAPAEPIDEPVPAEDRAQASARSSVVSEDELPPPPEPSERSNPDEEERPGLAELRQELNQQFESIKILRPGEYELNLMELYDREEYIIALEEDGRYVIDVPGTWRDDG